MDVSLFRHSAPLFHPKTIFFGEHTAQHGSTAMRMQIRNVLLLMSFGSALVNAAPDVTNLLKLGQESLAKADIAGATAIYTQACEQSSENSFTASQRAFCEHHLALIDEAAGNYPESEKRLLKALGEWQHAGAEFRPSYAVSLINLGELYRRWRRAAQAESILAQALTLAHSLRTEYPQIYGVALTRLAAVYAESQNAEKGRPLLEEAIPIFRSQQPKQDSELSGALDTLGMIDLVAARYKEAESLMAEALRLSISASGETHPETATRESDLALAYVQDQQFDRAEPLLKRALFVLESHAPVDESRRWMIYSQLSIVECARNRFSMAEEFASKALEILRQTSHPDAARLALARVNLAVVYIRSNRPADADRILPEAVADERRVAPGTALLADGLRELADLRSTQHSWSEAQALYKESLSIYQQRLGSNNASLVPILKAYVESLKRGGGSKADTKLAETQIKSIMNLSQKS